MCRHRSMISGKAMKQSHSQLQSRPTGSAQSAPLHLTASVKGHDRLPLILLQGRLGSWGKDVGETKDRVPLGTHRWECKEGYGEDRETGGDGLPDPRLGYLIPIADGGNCDLQGRRTAVSGWWAEDLRKDTRQLQPSIFITREINLKPCPL